MEWTIVAGGPSLRTFDWKSLSGNIIAINYAAIVIPQATICYFADKDWFDRFVHELRVHRGRKIQGYSRTDPVDQTVNVPWVERWEFVEGRLSSEVRTLCPGGHSGYAAVNVAVAEGAKHIRLLGYDFLISDRVDNFHDTHLRAKHYPAEWRSQWPYLLDELKKRGVSVRPEWPSPTCVSSEPARSQR